ncbi:MAG TPA: ATP-binding protein [Acidobacteriaceae bacterium]|jgi:PAS domain S-box-containing protein|nr:ATP-binding protein [Acidobacteriaceae bacterium]
MRLRIKLVLVVTAMVFAVVVALSGLYLAQLLSERIDQTYQHNDIIAHQVLLATRSALERGMVSYPQAVNNPVALRAAMVTVLHTDATLQQVLNSVIRYSPTVYDVTIADAKGNSLVSTDPTIQDQPAAVRPIFQVLLAANAWRQFRTVFGPPAVYDIDLALTRNGAPFLTVHVGVRTTFLRSQLAPWLKAELAVIFLALVVSLVLAALLSNVALSPLQVISDRLDQFMLAAPEGSAEPELLPPPKDEISKVSSKIERIGQRMRSVEEVFTALKANLNQVLENLQDGIMLFTRDGRAVMVSDSAERFLGLQRNQMFGMELHEIFDRQTALGQVVRRAFNARLPILQQEVETESGRHVEVSLDFIHGDAGGDPAETLGALLTLHDRESMKQIESELELSRRLADIGRLTSGVGHEVKNPINAIVVHLELMRSKLDRNEPGAIRHLEIIQGEIRRLDRVVQTLVDFSRPVNLELAVQDMRQVVSSVLALASPEMEQHQVRVLSRMPHQPIYARVDSDLIRQALLNVVLNGGQSMADGGELEVELRQEGRNAAIHVRDQGTGIPKEIQDRIFNLYFTTKRDGTGIGLAMTYRILQLHNGSIAIESTMNQGTEFTLRVPVSSSREMPTAGAPLSAENPPWMPAGTMQGVE